MLLNYLKLAIRVLARRKFFTFISLFGISFTLMVLMLVASYLESELGANPPLSDNQKLLIAPALIQSYFESDTIKKMDTTMVEGAMKIDTTVQIVKRKDASTISRSGINRRLLQDHFNSVEGVQYAAFIANNYTFDEYINNTKLTIHTSLVDKGFWHVFDFKFIEGRPMNDQEIDGAAHIAVITDVLAVKFFGNSQTIAGKEISVDDKHYKVIGVVKKPHTSADYLANDMMVPYTIYEANSRPQDNFGTFMGIFKIADDQDLYNVKSKLKHIASQLPIKDPNEFNDITMDVNTFNENYASRIFYDQDTSRSWRKFLWVLIGFMSLFVLLPVLNLINLNTSRIMDRSSEIGVRKAFGANTDNILFQFIFENIVQTLLGGIIGFILALVAIYLINDSQVLDNVKLTINLKFFCTCFIIALLFGIISGLLPAWRMSKLSIVNALKQHQL